MTKQDGVVVSPIIRIIRIIADFVKTFKTILLRLPALLIAGCIWFLSSQSTLPQVKGVFGWDKLQHILAYGALSFTIGLWISPLFWKNRKVLALLLTTLIGSAYGAIDEFHQYFVPGRSSDIWDWLADTMGAFLGALAIMILFKIIRRSDSQGVAFETDENKRDKINEIVKTDDGISSNYHIS